MWHKRPQGQFVASFFFLICILVPWDRAMAQWGGPGGWHMGPGMMGGMGWIGVIFMMGFWVLLIIGLVYFIKWIFQLVPIHK